ncbi:MAG TPA: hypothetical protein VFP47_04710, partial [Pyrinomonadaceae bacterium]|nr:hypothetical protein [Pyrinomonadaceae bacterium]
MSYRRRKGTAAILEQLARDTTDWNASVVEYFKQLATTQYMNHIRLDNLSVASLHSAAALESIGAPFDSVARTADVRRIESRRGKYNIPNVGIFLWRLNDYSVTNGQPYRVDSRRYVFDPIGKDTQLFNRSDPENEITHLAEPINVPTEISRRVFHRSLTTYYGDGKSILLSEKDPAAPTKLKAIDSSRVKVCDLRDLTDASGNIVKDGNGKALWAHLPDDKIAIDPVLGRITFPPNQIPENLHVTYHYAFSADMGGGEYERLSSLSTALPQVKVPDDKSKIQQALNQAKKPGGVVEITNNDQYFG